MKERILIVDDTVSNVQLLFELLKDKYVLSAATNGKKAIKLAKDIKTRPDMILLDVMMPDMDGYEVCRILKEDPETRDISIIFVTAMSDVVNELKGLEFGVVDYVSKPFEPAILLNRIKNQLELRSLNKKLQSVNEQLKDSLNNLKYFDSLTGLPNKENTFEEVDRRIGYYKKNRCKFNVASIRISNLNEITDAYDYETGNKAILYFIASIRNLIDKECFIGKVGDNQYLLLSSFVSVQNTNKGLEYIVDYFKNNPFVYNNAYYYLSLRFGVSIYPDDGLTANYIIKASNLAMNNDDRLTEENIRYYSHDLARSQRKEVIILNKLKVAINEGSFRLFYQPKINVEGNIIVGSEALIRWTDSKLGFIPPDVFIDIAEKYGLIKDISKWVLAETARQINEWKKKGLMFCPVSINLSPHDFQDKNFIDGFTEYIEKNKLSGDDLEIEITEGALVDNIEEVINKINTLKKLGFKTLIDDFGTGYSSLSYLKQFDVNTLKIDRSFIKDYPDKDNGTIAGIIVNLASFLGLNVVAEGVETKAQVDFLRNLGCGIIQGYYYSKPLPAEEFTNKLDRQKKVLG